MRKYITCIILLSLFASGTSFGQNVGVGQTAPASKLDVMGGMSVGSGYSGTNTAPSDGLIIQGQVGIGTSSPNSSAALDISSSTGGILIPRMSTRPASPSAGMQIYNTSNNCIEIYIGTVWQSVNCPCTGAPSAPSAISGNFTNLCKTVTEPLVYLFSVPAVSGATSYTWTVTGDPGAMIGGQGTNGVSVTFASTTATAISCVATNACGSSTAVSQSLSFATATAPVATSATFTSTSSSFIANWNSAVGATGYYLDVSTSSTFSSFLSGYNNLNVGHALSYTVSGLTCGTTYYYRVRQYNLCATSSSSNTITAIAHSTGSQTYSSATAGTTFTIPCGVTSINVKMWGGGGGGGWFGAGGGGGYVSGTYAIPTGTTSLTVVVGDGGATNYLVGTQGSVGTAAIGGGGAGLCSGTGGIYCSGSGGGMSALKNGSTYLLVAGGGGGGGSDDPSALYPYGGPGGISGVNTGNGGYGGTQSSAAGHAGGATTTPGGGGTGSTGLSGTAGTAGQGGQGNGGSWAALGTYEYGGGGGYPKGGGGGGGSANTTGTTVTYVGGGGGGASYYTGATGVSAGVSSPATNVDGYDFNPPQNTNDASYIAAGSSAGVGGDYSPTAGTAGLVVISW